MGQNKKLPRNHGVPIEKKPALFATNADFAFCFTTSNNELTARNTDKNNDRFVAIRHLVKGRFAVDILGIVMEIG